MLRIRDVECLHTNFLFSLIYWVQKNSLIVTEKCRENGIACLRKGNNCGGVRYDIHLWLESQMQWIQDKLYCWTSSNPPWDIWKVVRKPFEMYRLKITFRINLKSPLQISQRVDGNPGLWKQLEIDSLCTGVHHLYVSSTIKDSIEEI